MEQQLTRRQRAREVAFVQTEVGEAATRETRANVRAREALDDATSRRAFHAVAAS
jgi:hypothetical protein